MEKNKRISFVFLMLFGTLCFLAAQTTLPATDPAASTGQPSKEAAASQGEAISQSENLSYYIVETTEGVRFIQHIEWDHVQYISRYEIFLEQQNPADKSYKQVLNEFTEVNFVEVSIPAGKYRYKLKIYNLLGKLDGESSWQDFEVFLAIQPTVETFTPKNFYLDEEAPTSIIVTGKNFVEAADVFLVTSAVPGKAQGSVTKISPAQKIIDPSGQSVELIFDEVDLKSGLYDVVVQNPGGLKDSGGPFNIAFQKPLDLNVAIGWTPLIMFNFMSTSNDNYGVVNDFFESIHFLSATIRVTFIPIKKAYGYFGIELAPYASYFSDGKDGYTFEGFFAGTHLNLVYQKHFKKRKIVGNLRMGGGLSTFYDLKVEYSGGLVSDPINTWFFSSNVGLSLQYFIDKNMFIDVGADYQYNFTEGMSNALIRPGVFIGWQF